MENARTYEISVVIHEMDYDLTILNPEPDKYAVYYKTDFIGSILRITGDVTSIKWITRDANLQPIVKLLGKYIDEADR